LSSALSTCAIGVIDFAFVISEAVALFTLVYRFFAGTFTEGALLFLHRNFLARVVKLVR